MPHLAIRILNTFVLLLLHSILSALWCTYLTRKHTYFLEENHSKLKKDHGLPINDLRPIYPTIVTAPISLFLVYKAAKYNLLLLSSTPSSIEYMIHYGTLGLILFVGSGIPFSIKRNVKHAFFKLGQLTFKNSSICLGIRPKFITHKLVFMYALTRSYLECLGILFCELFIIEPLMNYNGLASGIWLSFTKLNWNDFSPAILAYLSVFYLFLVSTRITNHWLKERLKGYDV
ncbi:MAG: hypothetical protein HRU09_08310 [Oligoflexales bacterium]|nr:hypothetical protein [Oligoflexales bacterium]